MATELDAERARREELEHAMQAMQRESLRLQQANEELGGEHAACGPAVQAREAEIERLKQAIADVEEKLSKVETSREEERAAHKAQVEEERQRLAALREEHRNVQSALGRLWQLQSEAEWQLAEMRSEVDKLQHELSSAPRALPVDARVMLQKWQVPIILGEGGTIPRRIQRASGAQIEVKEADGDRFACVELRGAQQQCRWDGVLCGV
jgi:predicted  nucleic acid-binding Zn-ribbon protein